MKLWWPHSEALCTTLYLYTLTNMVEFREAYEKIFNYTFSTFPNRELGEWIQIRQRNGKPEVFPIAAAQSSRADFSCAKFQSVSKGYFSIFQTGNI